MQIPFDGKITAGSEKKLLSFGFQKDGRQYRFEYPLKEKGFKASYVLSAEGLDVKVIDQGIGEEYLLLESASSGYASLLREEVEAEAKKIFTECFDLRDRTEEIRKAVRDSFPCTVETPWEEYPDFYVFRRTDSKKWFGLLMKVPYRKLGMEREGKALVLNLKLAPERIQGLIDGKNYLVCYHMNKKEWITVLISPSFPLKTLLSLLKESFALTAKKK